MILSSLAANTAREDDFLSKEIRDPFGDSEPILTKDGIVLAIRGKHKVIKDAEGEMSVIAIEKGDT